MFERFGEMSSCREINELAENLLNEGDIQSLKVMAQENGIPEDYVEMYQSGDIPYLCDAVTAAMGKLDVECGSLKLAGLMNDWVEYIRGLCMEDEMVAHQVRKKGKDKRDGSKEDDSFKVATSDDASITVSFQMSYRYDPDTVIDTYKRFKGMDGEDIIENRVKTVLKSKISEVTTDYSMMDIYSGNRSELNNAITEYLNKDFHKKYGIEVLDASIVDVHPDKKLKQAIDNRVTALQEKQQAQAEQEKVKVQKETEKLQAEADAQIELTKAEADAKKAKVKAAAEAENTKTKAKAQAEANKELSASITDELIKMKEAEAHYKNGWVTVQGADAVIADK